MIQNVIHLYNMYILFESYVKNILEIGKNVCICKGNPFHDSSKDQNDYY